MRQLTPLKKKWELSEVLRFETMNPTLTCPFCGKEAPWVENKEIYGKNLGKSFMCYYCKDCDASVGCHENTTVPLGIMANRETKHMRIKAHRHIDPYWKSGKIGRQSLYTRISIELGKPMHIGEADIATCQAILDLDINLLIKGAKVERLKHAERRRKR